MDPKATLAAAVSALALVGALFSLDARYVHAEENKREIATTQQKIDQTHQKIAQTQQIVTFTTNNLRRAMLEDKVFEIDVKLAQKKITPVDSALKERYLRQIEEIKNETPKVP